MKVWELIEKLQEADSYEEVYIMTDIYRDKNSTPQGYDIDSVTVNGSVEIMTFLDMNKIF